MANLTQHMRALHRMFTPPRFKVSETGGFSIAYRPATADEKVIEQSFRHPVFPVAGYQPRADDTILNIGAHIGCFAVPASSYVPMGQVHAVEASRGTYNLLNANIALNGTDNVRAHHLALSDKDGTAELYHDLAGNWGHSTVAKLSSRAETVRAQTLEQFFARHSIERVHFAKLNCEGAEFPILLSAPVATLRAIDLLHILIHCDLAETYRLEQLTEKLLAADFDLDVKTNAKRRGRIVATRRLRSGHGTSGARTSLS